MTFTDHLMVSQQDPFAALSAIAAVTEQLRVGTLVADMGLRNPVIAAKAAATLQQLSGGRFELGVGAGYVVGNFRATGTPWLPARGRIARLEESIQVMRHLWHDETTTFHGDHFTIDGAPRSLGQPIDVPLLVGGGGPKVMAVAGRQADVASLIPRQDTGDWSMPASLDDSTEDRMAEKAGWVRAAAEAAGRDPDAIELNTMVYRTAIADDPGPDRAHLAEQEGVPVAATTESSLFLTGTPDEVRQRVQERRERSGISYYSLFDPGEETIEVVARELVAPLAGT